MAAFKIAVFGAGRMGSVVAWDLCRSDAVERVTLVDSSANALDAVQHWIEASAHGHKLGVQRRDVVRDTLSLESMLRGQDAAVITMPNRRASYSVIRTAIKAKCPVADIIEEYHRVPDEEEIEGLDTSGLTLPEFGEKLHEDAVAAGICVLDGMGFEPGLTNVTAAAGIRQLDQPGVALEVRVRVGGVPAAQFRDLHPLGYMLTWSFEHVLREYVIKTRVLRNDAVEVVEAGTEIEPVEIPLGGLGDDDEPAKLEAAYTPGMPSYLHTWKDRLQGRIRDFDAKTLRWPGHWGSIDVLKRLGFLAADRLTGISVSHLGRDDCQLELRVPPRHLLADFLTPNLRPRRGEFDLAVMRSTVTAHGNGGGKKEYRLAVHGDPTGSLNDRLTAMAKVTAFPAAWGGLALAARRFGDVFGLIAPEEVVFDHPGEGPKHLSDLRAYLRSEGRGVEIFES